MYCEKCGAELKDGQSFCERCGAVCRYPYDYTGRDHFDLRPVYASPDVMGGKVFDEDDYSSRILLDPFLTHAPSLDERAREVADEVARTRRSVEQLHREAERAVALDSGLRASLVDALEDCAHDLNRIELVLRGAAETSRAAQEKQCPNDPKPQTAILGMGNMLGDRLKVGRLLKGMGLLNVYEVSDTQGGGALCIAKVVESVSAVWLVREESRILAKLDHPRIPQLIVSATEEGVSWLVEQRLAGSPMYEETVTPWYGREVCQWMIQVCDALAYLHRQDPPILHHDIKPANILVDAEDEARLIDFSVAMECDPEGKPDVLVVGTMGFAVPETIGEPHRSDPRSDIYSVGATMWYLLADYAMRDRYFSAPLPDVRVGKENDTRKPISDEMAEVIMKCVSMNPDDRYQTADELATALRLVLASYEAGSLGDVESIWTEWHVGAELGCGRLARCIAFHAPRWLPRCWAAIGTTRGSTRIPLVSCSNG